MPDLNAIKLNLFNVALAKVKQGLELDTRLVNKLKELGLYKWFSDED